MTAEITQPITVQFTKLLSQAAIKPDQIWNVPVAASVAQTPTGNPFQLGCALHRVLQRMADHRRLNQEERKHIHWISALRAELRRQGVTQLTPEVWLDGEGHFPNGSADLLLDGGLSPRGVAEVKVVSALPESAAPSHLLQLSGYEELVARRFGGQNLWGCIAYICIRERKIRIFAYRNIDDLRAAARQVLAA